MGVVGILLYTTLYYTSGNIRNDVRHKKDMGSLYGVTQKFSKPNLLLFGVRSGAQKELNCVKYWRSLVKKETTPILGSLLSRSNSNVCEIFEEGNLDQRPLVFPVSSLKVPLSETR